MKIYTINVDFTQPKDIRLVLPTAEAIGLKFSGSNGWRNGKNAYLDGRPTYWNVFLTVDNTKDQTFVIDKPVDGKIRITNSAAAGGFKIEFYLYIEVADEAITTEPDVAVTDTLDASDNPISSKGIAEIFAAMGYAFGATYAYFTTSDQKWHVVSPANKTLSGGLPADTTSLLIGKDIILTENLWGGSHIPVPPNLHYIWFEDGRTLAIPNLVGTKAWTAPYTISIPESVEQFATGNMSQCHSLIIRGGYSAYMGDWDVNLHSNATVYVDNIYIAGDLYDILGKGSAKGYDIAYKAPMVTYTPPET